MPRVLYIDTPFELGSGGDRNRSRFLWNTISAGHDADLLLVHPHSDQPKPSSVAFELHAPILELDATAPGFYESRSIHHFPRASLQIARELLTRRSYHAVVCRFHSQWHLARTAAGHPSKPAIVVDLDRVPSHLVSLAWRESPSFQNRDLLLERLKLQWLEHRLLCKPWLILFSNSHERDQLALDSARPGSRVHLGVLPHALIPAVPLPAYELRPVILFFGDFASIANTNAFQFLIREILPRIDGDLRRHRVEIHVAGRAIPDAFHRQIADSRTDRVVLKGDLTATDLAIAESRFVLLPLRIASGSRTRILEAAAQFRTVVTTPLAAEGLSVGNDVVLGTNADELAAGIRRLLDSPDRAVELGRRLGERCYSRYSVPRIAAEFNAQFDAACDAHHGSHGPRSGSGSTAESVSKPAPCARDL